MSDPTPTPVPVPASTPTPAPAESPSQALASAASDPATQSATGAAAGASAPCGTPASTPVPAPAPTPQMAHIAVHVQDPSGKPIQGAAVSVGCRPWKGTTDGDGNFDFGDVPPGQYTVDGKLGSATASPQTKNAPAGATTVYVLTIPWILTCQWLDPQALCGDNAKLQVTVTPTPPDGAVTVEVLHPSSGATVDTVQGTMKGGTVQLTWMAKAQTANWRTDKMSFRATASSVGVKATSSNQFTFRQRPTTNWILIDVSHPTGNGFTPAAEKHDARLEADQVHYNLKLRTFGDPFDATKQAAAKSVIENVWNNGWTGRKFHRKNCKRGQACDCAFDCCKVKFHMDVTFVATGEHIPVKVFVTAPGSPRHRSHMGANGGEWGDPPIDASSTYAHETGHVLGQFDEYPTGAIDPGSPPVQPATATTSNLMSTSGNTTLLNRHYRRVLAFLNGHSGGDPYEIVPPGD